MDCIQNFLNPVRITRFNNDHVKTMLFPLQTHAFRIIHMQVNIKGMGPLGRLGVFAETSRMMYGIHDSVNANAMQPQPPFYP